MAVPSRAHVSAFRTAISLLSLVLGVLAVLSLAPLPAHAGSVNYEVGVYPIASSPDGESMPDVEGDLVTWRHSPESGPAFDAWCQIGSDTATYFAYTPIVGSGPRLRNGLVYSLTSAGLRVTAAASKTSSTVPATSFGSGKLVISDDGLATWASSMWSAAVYDTNDEALTIVPYSAIPRLPNERYTWAFIQPMAAGTRLLLSGDYSECVYIGPVSTWDSATETRTVWGTGDSLPPHGTTFSRPSTSHGST